MQDQELRDNNDVVASKKIKAHFYLFLVHFQRTKHKKKELQPKIKSFNIIKN